MRNVSRLRVSQILSLYLDNASSTIDGIYENVLLEIFMSTSNKLM